MKKITLFFRFWVLNSLIIISTFISNGQENIIKTGITGYLLGDFNLGFERMTTENQSVQFKMGYFMPVLSPVISEKTITPSEYDYVGSKGSVQMSLEYRFYTSKQGLKGFYLGPYLRYYGIRAEYTDIIQVKTFHVDGSVNNFGTGFQLGYHFIFNESFSLDISFFGAGIDKNNVKLVYTNDQQNFNYNEIVDDVSEVFEDIPYFEKRLKNEVNSDNLTSRLPFIFPGLRASVSLGIAF